MPRVARLREALVLVDGIWFGQTGAAADSIVISVHEHCGIQSHHTLAHEVGENHGCLFIEYLRTKLQHVPVAAGTTPILRIISKHQLKRLTL